MEKQRSDVISSIRGCLISTKGKIPLRQLEKDYRTLIGERIPYQKVGFKSLTDFIDSVPTLVLSEQNGELYVDAKINSKSAHISEMVCKQKTGKNKVFRNSVPPPRFSSLPPRNWRPKYVQKNTSYQTTSRPKAVSHNQFVDRSSYSAPSVPSKIVIPESSSFGKTVKKTDLSNRLLPKPESTSSAQNNYTNRHAPAQNGTSKKDNHEVSNHNSNTNRVLRRVEFNIPSSSQNESTSTSARAQSQTKPEINSTPNGFTSTRMNICQKMSEINLDRDSGNSSPISEFGQHIANGGNTSPLKMAGAFSPNIALVDRIIAPKVTVQPTSTGNPMTDLRNFAEFHKMGEVESTSKRVKTKQNHFWSSKIKIGKHTYASYPEEFADAASAEKHCAKEALKDLESKYGRRKSLLLSGQKEILERIPPMLEKHNNGIWVWQLQEDYTDKYNEQLPSDWLKIIDSSPGIQVEKFQSSYIIKHCRPEDKGGMRGTFMHISNVSVPSNTVQLSADGSVQGEVTCVMAANEVWCRQCNTEESNQHIEAMGRMELYYARNHASLKPDNITKNCYYAAEYEGTWFRVRVLETNETEVMCFLIDFGEEIAIPRKNIYQLKREFATSQAQAFVCRLIGLEVLYEFSLNSEILHDMLLYKQVQLELAPDTAVENDLCLPVYMYDVDGKSINEQLITLLTIESATPAISKDGVATQVYVSNIESNGDVYVQVHSHGFDVLLNRLEELEAEVRANPPTHLVSPVTKAYSNGVTFLAQYKTDRHWYRIQVIDWSPKEDLAQIYFLDYGNTDVINVNEEIMYPLHKLDDVLNQYPPQAVRVRMDLETIPDDFVDLATKAMPNDQPVLIRLTGKEEDNLPLAEFFRRDPDGGLFCVNMSISMEAKLKKENQSPRKKLHIDGTNVPSGGKLSCPALPEMGTYMMVHVPFAVNPYNFFVQPFESQDKLNKMMEKLQERYKDVVYSPLQIDQIIPGNIYASKFDDGHWYRTTAIKVINSGSISVFYCDFGYYSTLTVQQLIPLDVEFMELPYQALKAKHGGIKPKQSKWTMDDCDYFKQLVEKKTFYSVLLSKEKDELYDSDFVLSLMLVDTSSTEDKLITKELIDKGVAVKGFWPVVTLQPQS
ncbi:unnamed protein product [Acanthoscelides obtectus]|uniref:Tudor domain-containing protein 7 n=1 Tax=Acanthoscelides obtectus TaxID=200917 RepID=A0A9P0PRV7_ACAOB|nr:unnamed protein product [Acanthoscelides obtectus]CAK1663599.1 Tudor domain-containing protein 7 [Acanthoscelides obtectus]